MDGTTHAELMVAMLEARSGRLTIQPRIVMEKVAYYTYRSVLRVITIGIMLARMVCF